ncbi:GDSL-type esterase/lipase family protein [Svornostia abyssi]|uniref:GDSL-type esterase/lipase family protein n=1 Tax=Svornostia abyssi TaxID=2898438 RepID=A0ABY5PIT0_9ACTN|nr:GDSL-type esterase/lipase family protein [Parviterribacteraceae bacterium J379]
MLAVRRLVLTLALTVPCVLAAPAAAAVPTIVVGDSLAVGTKPYLGSLLPGYPLTWDVRNGRTTPEGMRALRAKLREVQPGAVVVSLGSNDGPDPARFADRMRRILAAIPPSSCVIWPSIVRPDRKGDETGLNRVLRRMAAADDRLTLIDWQGAVQRGAVILPDGLHPDPAGYQRRSQMIATALQRNCAAPDTGTDTPSAPAEGGVPAPSS